MNKVISIKDLSLSEFLEFHQKLENNGNKLYMSTEERREMTEEEWDEYKDEYNYFGMTSTDEFAGKRYNSSFEIISIEEMYQELGINNNYEVY